MATRAGTRAPAELRLVSRLALGAALASAAAVPLLGLLLLVEGRYQGLEDLDRGVADGLNTWARHHSGAVSTLEVLQAVLSPNTFRVAVVLVAVALWRTGARRLATWAVGTTAVGALMGVVLKQLVHRARPTFPDPVASAGSYSFPSGHALGSFLGCGILLLIALPLLGRPGRAWAWATAAFLVLLTGFDRIALGVHFVSDVVGGWVAAGALLVGTATAFGTWRGPRRPSDGVDPAGSGCAARALRTDRR